VLAFINHTKYVQTINYVMIQNDKKASNVGRVNIG